MCEPCEALPPLSLCVRGILQAFDRHASKDEDRMTLSKKELRGLMRREMGPEIVKATAQKRLGELFDLMDQNGDQKMDFPEFMGALGAVTCMIHDRLCMMPIVCQPPIMVCEPCGPRDPPIVCLPPITVCEPCGPRDPPIVCLPPITVCEPCGPREGPIVCVMPEPEAPPCEG